MGGVSIEDMNASPLQQSLADVQSDKLDVIIAYIGRLTRTLTDVAKLVEPFVRYGVPFISATQQINTTTLMVGGEGVVSMTTFRRMSTCAANISHRVRGALLSPTIPVHNWRDRKNPRPTPVSDRPEPTR